MLRHLWPLNPIALLWVVSGNQQDQQVIGDEDSYALCLWCLNATDPSYMPLQGQGLGRWQDCQMFCCSYTPHCPSWHRRRPRSAAEHSRVMLPSYESSCLLCVLVVHRMGKWTSTSWCHHKKRLQWHYPNNALIKVVDIFDLLVIPWWFNLDSIDNLHLNIIKHLVQ